MIHIDGKSFTADAARAVRIEAKGLNNDLHGSAAYRAHLISVIAARAVAAAERTLRAGITTERDLGTEGLQQQRVGTGDPGVQHVAADRHRQPGDAALGGEGALHRDLAVEGDRLLAVHRGEHGRQRPWRATGRVVDGVLRVRVMAPAVEGAANRELIQVLAERGFPIEAG